MRLSSMLAGMSEPKARAKRIRELVDGVHHWSVYDDRIDHRSEAYAVAAGDGVVLIDPLPLADDALGTLGNVSAIVLTGGFHQRASWSLRERLGVPVHAPAGAAGLEKRPDRWYDDGQRPAGGLLALQRPGPTQPHCVLIRDRTAPVVLFCADLLMRGADGPFRFVPREHQDDPEQTRRSVRDCLTLGADALCPAHGAPAAEAGTAAMQAALDLDDGR